MLVTELIQGLEENSSSERNCIAHKSGLSTSFVFMMIAGHSTIMFSVKFGKDIPVYVKTCIQLIQEV